MIRENTTEGLKTWLKSPMNYLLGLLGRHKWSFLSCSCQTSQSNDTDRGANCYSEMKPRAHTL